MKFFTYLKTKFTIGIIVSSILSLVFAILLRNGMELYLNITPIFGGLCGTDLSYAGIVLVFRFLIKELIEFLFPDLCMLPIDGPFKGGVFKESTIMCMDNKDSTQTGSSNHKYDSSNTVNKLTADESLELNDNMHSALKHSLKMVHTMSDIKRTTGVTLIIDKQGNLCLSAPNSISDDDLNVIQKKIGISDRVYNTEIERYKELCLKDKTHNNSMNSSTFKNSYDNILKRHNDLFEKE